MKSCPNCQAELEDNFELCWNCNYSLTEQQVLVFGETTQNHRTLDCLRCGVRMVYSGNYRFHEGTRLGVLGNLFEAFVNRESFDLYLCPKCGKVEFFTSLGQVTS